MRLLKHLFGKKPVAKDPEQAVIVYLDTVGLPPEVYRDYDFRTIQDKLLEAMERDKLGDYADNEVGEVLFLYGPDAERLFAGVEQTLRNYPLCRGARVVIRRGDTGAPQRALIL